MTDNVQTVKGNLQIKFTEVKSVGEQRKQRNLAKKLPKKKIRREKQNQSQEMSIQDDAVEDVTPSMEHRADKDELIKDGSGKILDIEI